MLRNGFMPEIGVTLGQFINILRATFLPIFWCQKIAKPNVIREKLLNLLLVQKLARKMLIKLSRIESILSSLIYNNGAIKSIVMDT